MHPRAAPGRPVRWGFSFALPAASGGLHPRRRSVAHRRPAAAVRANAWRSVPILMGFAQTKRDRTPSESHVCVCVRERERDRECVCGVCRAERAMARSRTHRHSKCCMRAVAAAQDHGEMYVSLHAARCVRVRHKSAQRHQVFQARDITREFGASALSNCGSGGVCRMRSRWARPTHTSQIRPVAAIYRP